MKLFKILFLLLFMVEFMMAQNAKSVQVNLIDHAFKPVSFGTAILYNAVDSAVVKYEIADENGKIEFLEISKGEYYLEASSLGYKNVSSKVFKITGTEDKVQLPSVEMAAASQNIEEVVVTAKKPYLERKLDRLIVNVEASITAVGSSVLEILERAPGVLVNQETSINLKGKQGVLVMIDGRLSPLSGPDLINYLKSIPSSNIESIEIISNPSAKYDAAGNAGIIDIKFKKDQKLGFNGGMTLSIGQGFYFKPNASINTNYRNKKFNIYSSYSYSRAVGYTRFYINRKFFDNQRNINSIFDQTSFIKQPIKSHNPKIGMDYYVSKNTVVGILMNGNIFANNRTGSTNSLITNNMNELLYSTKTVISLDNLRSNAFANFNIKHKLDSLGKELSFDIDYGRYNSSADQSFSNNYFNPLNELISNTTLFTDQEGKINVKSIKLDYVRPIKNDQKMEVGLKSSIVNTNNEIEFYNLVDNTNVLDPENSNHFLYRENINAAYINYLKESTKFDLQFGLRLEHSKTKGEQLANDLTFDRSYLYLFPSGVLNLKTEGSSQYSISYSRRIDRPSYQQLNPFRIFVDPYTYVVGDPSLKPVLTNAFELTHTYKGRYSTSLNYSKSKQTITDIFKQDDDTKVSYQIPANLQDLDQFYLSSSIPFNVGNGFNGLFVPSVYWSKYVSPLLGGTLTNQSFSWDARLQAGYSFGKSGWSTELNSFYQSRNVWGQFIIKDLAQVTLGVQKVSKNKLTTYKLSISDIFKTNHIAVIVDYLNQSFHTNRTWDSRVASVSISHRFGKNTVERSRQRNTGIEDEKKRAS